MELGQDRFYRRYWVLPHCGGVWVEGHESAYLDNDRLEQWVKQEQGDIKTTILPSIVTPKQEVVKTEIKSEPHESENVVKSDLVVKSEMKSEDLNPEPSGPVKTAMDDSRTMLSFTNSVCNPAMPAVVDYLDSKLSNGDISDVIAMDSDICEVSPMKVLKQRQQMCEEWMGGENTGIQQLHDMVEGTEMDRGQQNGLPERR